MSNSIQDISLNDIESIYAATDTGLIQSGKNEAGNGSHVSITECAPSHIGMHVKDISENNLGRYVRGWVKSLPLSKKQISVLIMNNAPNAVNNIKDWMSESIQGTNQRIKEGNMVTPIPHLDKGLTMADVVTANDTRLPEDADPEFKSKVSNWGSAFRR